MDKTYDPHRIEADWYPRWEQRGYFAPRGEGQPYCIMLPPPNVTGTLHMGHAFQHTLIDILIRWQRMRGARTLWQPGTDHAGIATQMVVERQLEAQGQSRQTLGATPEAAREAFLARVWAWKDKSGSEIGRQLRRLGTSPDWSRERFTMDPALSTAVTEVFVQLFEQGLIYRGKRLVNWDPVLQTAISDLEVLPTEEAGHLWHFRYPLLEADGTPSASESLVVATTRPETMLGDAAVAVHPEDERYRHLVGRQVWLPLAEREIPVLADDYVDPDFGTGCVKITPAHDFNDYAVWSRHRDALAGLPGGGLLNVMAPDASLARQAAAAGNDAAVPAAYRGLDRLEARRRIVADMDAAGLLAQVDDHRLTVPRGDRSGAPIEPYLTDQWFVDLTRERQEDGREGGHRAITAPALAAVSEGAIEFIPGNWRKTYDQWLEHIQDWCISRQLWWGHRIPAWYDEDGRVYVGRSEAEVRARHGLEASVRLQQDEDVLDTWFSSALWPFSTLGWPQETPELANFYPTNVLVTGFDIIFFWVARMVMMGRHFTGEVPFRHVYIHGLVRDAQGQKMSKSKGNVLDPIDLIDGITLEALVAKRTAAMMQPHQAVRIERETRRQFPQGIPAYGTDALRFTFASQASTGRDIKFDLGRIEGYRNFCNKLWNAARFVLMHTEQTEPRTNVPEPMPGAAERWIVSRLQRVEQTVQASLDAYRFDLAAQAIYEFIWNEYCDWYLELAKVTLQDPAAEPGRVEATRQTLVRVLETALRLTHPFMPFITEALWQRLGPLAGREGETIMLQRYPEAEPARLDPAAEAELDWVMGFVLGVRRIRGEMDIAPSRRLSVLLQHAGEADRERWQRHAPTLQALAGIGQVRLLDADEQAPESATALLGQLVILVPLAGLIDRDAELARLERQLERLTADRERVSGKLANDNFVSRAPATVVDKERARLTELEQAVAELSRQRERIAALPAG